MNAKSGFTFPVGYHEFHKDQLFNYQLNRWYSFGYARFEDMEEASQGINNFEDWKNQMLKLAEKAVSDDRLINAAFYYRAAEFYLLYDDPDELVWYDKFIDLFYQAFQNDDMKDWKCHTMELSCP